MGFDSRQLQAAVWHWMVDDVGCATTPAIMRFLREKKSTSGTRARWRLGALSAYQISQALSRSRLFRKAGREYAVCATSNSRTRYTVWEPRCLDEIIEPYVQPGHTPMRRLERQPKFVRDAVRIARGEMG